MRNSLFLIFLFLIISKTSFAEILNIEAETIKINKKEEVSVFKNKVIIKDESLNLIKSEYAEFNKVKNFLTLKDNVIILDEDGNEFYTEHATYDKNNKIVKSIGNSKIISAHGYIVNTDGLVINKKTDSVFSKTDSTIEDLEGNIISLKNFEFLSNKNIFKSIGEINVKDKMGNSYFFSQIYIDERKKEIIGTDAKSYLNQKSF